MTQLPEFLRPFREITVEHCNGARPTESPLSATLIVLGFRRAMNQTMTYDTY